jgi:hypothetical protein
MPPLVSAKSATIIFSNGSTLTTLSLPSAGVLSDSHGAFGDTAIASLQAPLLFEMGVGEHSVMLEKNRYLAQALITKAKSTRADTFSTIPVQPPYATPAVGATRTWNDLFNVSYANGGNNPVGDPVYYLTTAHTVCSVSSGRKVVFWLDPNAVSAGVVTSSDIAAMSDAVCGTGNGFDKMNSLIGDFWGTTSYNNLIQESSQSLQDINIVIANAPSGTGWAGYFYSPNNFLSTSYTYSNQALVFFINASQIKINRNFITSTLLHEATHMANFYQRSVLRGASHDTWLEETSAMMTEDIVTPTILSGYNKIATYRIPNYLSTGGAVSYINWPQLSSNNYMMGGAFGAYLNRRYGLSIYKQLVTTCLDGGSTTSYQCLDTLITANGGLGIADELAHMGAAVFSVLPTSAAPDKYGFPAKVDGVNSLQAIDISAFSGYRPATATTLPVTGFTATTHTYQIDPISIGKTSYVRTNIIVPAKATMLLVIK